MAQQEDDKREEQRVREVYERRERHIPADRYSPSNLANTLIKEEKHRQLLSQLHRFRCMPLYNKRILDVGCGQGFGMRKFLDWGATPENLFGIDLMPGYIEQARRGLPAAVTLEAGSATNLDYGDASFDLVLQSTVFSSILHDATKIRIANEMLRVLKPAGYVIWYDFFVNNPWNPDVRGVRRREIHELFPQCRYHFCRITVAPPLARAISRSIPRAYGFVAGLKVFSTHYLGFFQKAQ